MLGIEGQDQKKRNFCDQSPSLLLAEPHVSVRISVLAASLACPGSRGWLVSPGHGERLPKAAALLPHKKGCTAHWPQGELAAPSRDAGDAAAVVVVTTWAALLLQEGKGATAWVLLPKQVPSSKMQLYRSLVKSLRKAAKI